MDINKELELVKDFDNSSKFINEPGVFIVKIKSYLLSESRKDYKGNPYIEFAVETEDQKTSNVTFYLLTGKESDKAREFKLKRLKEFLSNANADDKLKGDEYLNSIIGSKIKALFKKSEYIGKDKNNFNKPVIKEIIEYSFSSKPEETIKGVQSYFHTPLRPSDMEKFNLRLAEWESEYKQSATAATKAEPVADKGMSDDSLGDEKGDDLPF